MDCCITSLSSHTRFCPSQHTLHECLSSCTSWHSRFSNLITFLSIDCRCIPPWMQNYTVIHLAYEELISLFHHFPYISVAYLWSPSLSEYGLTQVMSRLLFVFFHVGDDCCCQSHRHTVLPVRAQAGPRHSLPLSMKYLDLEDNSESTSICTIKTVCLIKAGILLSFKKQNQRINEVE